MLKTSRHALPSRVFFGFLLFIGLAGVSFAQNDIVAPNGSAGYVRMPVAAIDNSTGQPVGSAPLLVFPDGADTSKGSFSSDANTAGSGPGGNAPAKTTCITTTPTAGVMTGFATRPTLCRPFSA